MPAYCLHMCCDQGVCVEIEADTAATLTKIAEAACFLSLQSVCEKWCVLFIDRGYFRAGGPFQLSSLHRPFHRSLIHIYRRSALLTYQRPASCDRCLAKPITCFPLWEHQHLSVPSPHPVQWLLCFFFFLTQWLKKKKKKKKERREQRRRRTAATGGRFKSMAAPNRLTASETVAE